MNQFEYTLKVEEMNNLKTKKSKYEFVLANKDISFSYADYYSVKLLIDMYNNIPHYIPNVKGLKTKISNLFGFIASEYIISGIEFDDNLLELYSDLVAIDTPVEV